MLSLGQPSRLFKLPLQHERTNPGSVRHLHLPSRACTYKKHCTLMSTHICFKDLVKKLDQTKNTQTKPQILLHTCSPETQFITLRAAVHVEPSFIALGTCITATFSLTNISSSSTTKQSWFPRNRIEIPHTSLCVYKNHNTFPYDTS